MLHQFLATHRADLIERCKTSASQRNAVDATGHDSPFGIPVFIDQLIHTLDREHTDGALAPDRGASADERAAAARHGQDLSQRGLTVDQVVHEYGDLCQAITGLAFELDAPITTREFKTLNRCLDNGMADAVTSFSYQRDLISSDRESQALNRRMGFLAHDLRDHLSTATYAIRLIKSGKAPLISATGAVLHRSLMGMRGVIDRSLADVRMSQGLSAHQQVLVMADFFDEVKASASLEAESRGCQFTVAEPDRDLVVKVDPDLLASALGNLLSNAFKFTQAGTGVLLTAVADDRAVRLEVRDHCGGLPPGDPEDLFRPFEQRSEDRSGVGLGLAIARRSVEANQGILTVRDVPEAGCVFCIELPRYFFANEPLGA